MIFNKISYLLQMVKWLTDYPVDGWLLVARQLQTLLITIRALLANKSMDYKTVEAIERPALKLVLKFQILL